MNSFRSILPPPAFLFVAAVLVMWMNINVRSEVEKRPLNESLASTEPSFSVAGVISFVPAPKATIDYSQRFELSRARPLFSETRRMPEPPTQTREPELPIEDVADEAISIVAVPETTEVELPDFKYLGLSSIGSTSRALFRSGETGAETWVGLGEAYFGWEVTHIEKNTVQLRNSKQVEVVKLDR